MTDTLLTDPDQKEGLSLVYARAVATRALVVLELPEGRRVAVDVVSTVTAEELVLRRLAYWLNLQQGHDEVIGRKTVTVRLPEQNIFDIEALRKLMQKSRKGEI